MTNLYVILDEDGKVIEACPQYMEGSQLIDADDSEIFDIVHLRKDAIVTGGQISSITEGDDYAKKQEELINNANA